MVRGKGKEGRRGATGERLGEGRERREGRVEQLY